MFCKSLPPLLDLSFTGLGGWLPVDDFCDFPSTVDFLSGDGDRGYASG